MPRPVADRAHTPIHVHRSGTTPNPGRIMQLTYKQRNVTTRAAPIGLETVTGDKPR